MIIFTIHTIQPAKSKQISSLRGLHARSNPSSCIRLLHSPDKSEQAVRNDERRRRNDVTIYFQNTLLTKDLLCGVLANVRRGAGCFIFINQKSKSYENNF